MQGAGFGTVAVAMVLMIGGCGDDADDRATPPSAGGGQEAQEPSVRTNPSGRRSAGDGEGRRRDSDAGGSRAEPSGSGRSEEDEVKAAVERLYGDIAAADARGVCSAMSRLARQQIARQVPGGTSTPAGQRTCAASMAKYLDAATQSGAAEALSRVAVGQVRVNGASATAQVTLGSKAGPLHLTREGDRWVFGPGAVAP